MSKSKFVGVALATKTTAVVARATTLAKAVASVATKFVAMAKFTDFATNVATLARFATAKAVAIKSAKLAIMAILASFTTATLTGCDEAKSLVASVSIEEPLVEIAYSNGGRPYLLIQSQDNDTVIEDVIINRGNCAINKWISKANTPQTYMESYMTEELCKEDLKNINGECKSMYPVKLPYGERFSPSHGIRGEMLFHPSLKCMISEIIEVELVVNGGGRLTYKFK